MSKGNKGGHKFKVISSFDDVPIQPDTLYVLDFDETVAYYDGINRKWWEDRFAHHYREHCDYDKADDLALKDWLEHIDYLDPQHVDQKGFKEIIEHCESEEHSHVVILTARDIRLEDITKKHLDILSPDKKIDIIFCNGDHKGEKLQEYLDGHEKDYLHIVFVDDHLDNLVNFKETHADALCFHMQLK